MMYDLNPESLITALQVINGSQVQFGAPDSETIALRIFAARKDFLGALERQQEEAPASEPGHFPRPVITPAASKNGDSPAVAASIP